MKSWWENGARPDINEKGEREGALSLSSNLVSYPDRIPSNTWKVQGLRLECSWARQGRAKGDIGETLTAFGGRAEADSEAGGPKQPARPCKQMEPRVALAKPSRLGKAGAPLVY